MNFTKENKKKWEIFRVFPNPKNVNKGKNFAKKKTGKQVVLGKKIFVFLTQRMMLERKNFTTRKT